VKPPPFDYHAPASLEEALQLKAKLGPDASVLAGGQSLVPMLNMRLARPSALIDLNRIEALAGVDASNGSVRVGAMTRHRALERSEEAYRVCPLLREALTLVAHTIVRNRGTIGGSIAHADPAAELPSVLVALGGTVTVASAGNERTIPAEDFFTFHFTTALADDEILTAVTFPGLPSGSGYAFDEVSRRHGDYALAGAACVIRDGTTRLAFLGVGPRPILVESDDPAVAAAAVEPASDVHATADYRRELVATLAERTLETARSRVEEGTR